MSRKSAGIYSAIVTYVVTGSPAQAASLANRKLQLSRAVSSWGSTDLFEGSWWIASLLATGFLLSPSISSCDEPPVRSLSLCVEDLQVQVVRI